MAGPLLEDSVDPWRYVILMSKFTVMFIDAGLTKSFGVLIPYVVGRYESDYKTAALVLSLPSSLMYLSVPFAIPLMKATSPRTMAVIGGLLSSVPVICAPFAESIYILGLMLAVAGFGMALTYFQCTASVFNYFQNTFIFSNTLTLFGGTCGAFLVPIIVERSLEAYGYTGAFLILGGISLHSVACSFATRPPRLKSKGHLPQEEKDPLTVAERHHQTDTDETEECETSNSLRDVKAEDSNCESDEDRTRETRVCCSFKSMVNSFVFFKEPFYTLTIPAVVLLFFVIPPWMLFLVPHAEGKGIKLSEAVFLSSMAGISGILGRILYLILLHLNYDSVVIFSSISVICAISFFLDHVSSTYIFLSTMACIQGFIIFILDSLPSTMLKLSVRNKENIPGAIATNACIVGMSVITGDVISGKIYDVTSSFSTLFVMYGVLLILVTINLIIFRVADRRWPRLEEP